jgi:signal transduction histidine kinase
MSWSENTATKPVSSLRSRVFLVCAFVAVLSIAIGTLFVTVRVSREAEAELRRDLQDAMDLLEEYQQQRYETLSVITEMVADLPRLKAAVATRDAPTIAPVAREYRKSLGADMMLITGADGDVLVSIGTPGPLLTPDAATHAARGEPSSYLGESSTGVVQLLTRPIVVGPEPLELLGVLTAGFHIDDELARELSALTQSEVVLVARDRPVAATLRMTTAELAALGSGIEDMVELEDDTYVTLRRSVATQYAQEGFEVVLLRSRSERLAFLETFRDGLLISALFGVLLAIVLSYVVARTVTQPLADITQTMRDITTTGDLKRRIGLRGRFVDADASLLASTFNSLTEAIVRFQREEASKERLSALGRMSAVLAHEIRNPLMIIKTSLRSLRNSVASSGDAKDAADDISHEVDRLNRMVGDVLDFARPVEPDLRPTDLNAVCRSAAQAVFIDETSPTLRLDLDETLAPLVTDGDRLRTALVNVLTNARDAVNDLEVDDGEAAVVLVTRVEDDKVSIDVVDHGVGMGASELPKIFEPYYTGKRTGTGLGLAITKNIVESLGGTVRAESRPSEGSAIRIELFREGGLR